MEDDAIGPGVYCYTPCGICMPYPARPKRICGIPGEYGAVLTEQCMCVSIKSK